MMVNVNENVGECEGKVVPMTYMTHGYQKRTRSKQIFTVSFGEGAQLNK